ncbi:accessory Sec system translocase SecA2 [uncultured Acetatifactor sp.]|uniref:accessory Sec system translocase SecA2 n=1 Tax=uncultured Acetatifactor sp. TaxID=1671927 RepID=UPI0026257D4D|nr:accessory Sec system translocase SecA2 [uncultured Acetatifactor sp.]
MRRTRHLKKLYKILRKVRSYEEQMARLTDQELARLTDEFRTRLAGGETLDGILPEAFAAICEADRRILGKSPFDVQVLGGIALHQGCLAEMHTGEGKTLMATLPLYLNALTGKLAILVTANEYLACRDAEELGPVYRFMGLTVATGVPTREQEEFGTEEKKAVYASDIVYTTHSALGFDYLMNNLVKNAKERFLREYYYVIVDEADSVLLDGAQTPLVISASPRVQSNLYEVADFFVTTLVEEEDYMLEEGKVWLTEEGIRYAETFFQIDNFYGREHFEINRHVILALRARKLFESGENYMVSREGELLLLDSSTGRTLKGMKLRGGQHQALEVKEGLKPTQESRAVAVITFQNLFRMFPKLAGMSGTMADAAEELRDIYGIKVVVIPPNRPGKRVDLPDRYFPNTKKQVAAAIINALEIHRTGRPVLIVAANIENTEKVHQAFLRKKIPHNVLSASNAYWEAQIVKEAGRQGAVTVATTMAGRGTDIKLGEGVEELGGLAVIGIGRMENVRMERQARGRAGRQGDAGSSQFFVSLQDDVMGENPAYDKYIEGKKRISRRRLQKYIDKAQVMGEESAVLSRKRSVDYDKVIQRQRNLIYATRDKLLEGEELPMEMILEMAERNIKRFLASGGLADMHALNRYILDNISYRLEDEAPDFAPGDRKAIERYLMERVRQGLEEQEKKTGSTGRMNQFMRVAVLSAIDEAWVEQVDYMQQLQSAVSGRATAQRNLLFEYQDDSFASFRSMEGTVYENAMRNILLSDIYVDEKRQLHIVFP